MIGGRGTEHNVYLLTGQDLRTWVPLERMLQAKFGHSSIILGSEKHVMVAEGLNVRGVALDSLELCNVGQDSWKFLYPLPSPRVNFTLQVLNSKITAGGGYHTKH